MTIAPPEPDEAQPDGPSREPAPDLPDPAFPEVLPGGDPGPGEAPEPDSEPETEPSPDGP